MKNLKTFGKALYELRISKDISLEKISQTTKINQIYFEEFEKGNFSIKSYVYIRLFLREYIKCIDATQVDVIMDEFDKIYSGKSNKQTLTFVPASQNSPDSNQDYSDNIFDSGNYTPQKIAFIIITFLVIMAIFWITGWMISSPQS